jgi:hypothetical protein
MAEDEDNEEEMYEEPEGEGEKDTTDDNIFGQTFSLSNRNLGCGCEDKDDITEEEKVLSIEKCNKCDKKDMCYVRNMLNEGVKELSDRHITLPLRVIASKSYAVEAIMNLLLDDATIKAKCDLLTLCSLLFRNISILDGFDLKMKAIEYTKGLQETEENSAYGFCHTAQKTSEALGITKEQVNEAKMETDKLIETLLAGGEPTTRETRGGVLAAIQTSTADLEKLFTTHLAAERDLTVKSLIIANFLRKIYMGTIAFKLTT